MSEPPYGWEGDELERAANRIIKRLPETQLEVELEEVMQERDDLRQRLAAAERERDENYRLWKEACRVKDIRHKAAKERRNSICLDCKCMRECLKVSDKWVCPECLTARLAAAEATLRAAQDGWNEEIHELNKVKNQLKSQSKMCEKLSEQAVEARDAARILYQIVWSCAYESQLSEVSPEYVEELCERWLWLNNDEDYYEQ